MRRLLTLATAVFAMGDVASGQSCPSFRPTFGEGLSSAPQSVTIFDQDGPTPPRLIAAGTTHAGGQAVGRMAGWDGVRWTPLGLDAPAGSYHRAMCSATDPSTGTRALFAGDTDFVRFDGQTWTVLPHPPTQPTFGSDSINYLHHFDPDGPGPEPEQIIAGVEYVNVTLNWVSELHIWNGLSWTQFGGGGWTHPRGMTTCTIPGQPRAVYIGLSGGFSIHSITSVAWSIQRWDGQQLSYVMGDECTPACGEGLTALVSMDDLPGGASSLYVAGNFRNIGGIAARVARWDGQNWQAADAGLGLNTWISQFAVVDFDGPGSEGPTLFAAAYTTSPLTTFIIQWDGTTWSPPVTLTGTGTGFDVLRLVAFDDGLPSLFAFRGFDAINGIPMSCAARTIGNLWAPVGQTLNRSVHAAVRAPSGPLAGGLYVGGSFFSAGRSIAPGVAHWDGTTWTGLGLGPDSHVDALAVASVGGADETLYAGGKFNSAGGIAAPHIARWDGAWWSALADGLNADVLTLVPSAGALIAGGEFTASGGIPLQRIARWNGAQWSALGSGFNASVRALAAIDSAPNATVVAGGDFTAAGGQPALRVAQWNGQWAALGPGFNGPVYALAVYNDGSGAAIFAAGAFESSGATPVSRIARWNGQSWTALGTGLNGPVRSLAVFDPDGSGPISARLAVGGEFTQAGGQSAARMAQWDGSAWHPFDVQPDDGAVLALCIADADGPGGRTMSLFAGGTFSRVGSASSPNIAQWSLCECYANCDHSTVAPILNASDFQCFLNRFAAFDPYANCDASTGSPALTANDFTCFLSRFAAGCA